MSLESKLNVDNSKNEWWNTKLFEFRGIDPLNKEFAKERLRYLRAVWDELKQDPRFRSLVVVGSSAKGYAKDADDAHEPSDIDIVVLYKLDAAGDGSASFIDEIDALVANAAAKAGGEFEESGKRSFNIHVAWDVSVNSFNFIYNDVHDAKANMRLALALAFPSVGNIEEFRSQIRDLLRMRGMQETQQWLDNILEYTMLVLYGGADSFQKKMHERGLVTEDNKKDFLASRKRLWRARFERLYDPWYKHTARK